MFFTRPGRSAPAAFSRPLGPSVRADRAISQIAGDPFRFSSVSPAYRARSVLSRNAPAVMARSEGRLKNASERTERFFFLQKSRRVYREDCPRIAAVVPVSRSATSHAPHRGGLHLRRNVFCCFFLYRKTHGIETVRPLTRFVKT